jgi:hypothetical protein
VVGGGYGLNDYNANLRKWLNTPVEVERTDALKEHDSVVWGLLDKSFEPVKSEVI